MRHGTMQVSRFLLTFLIGNLPQKQHPGWQLEASLPLPPRLTGGPGGPIICQGGREMLGKWRKRCRLGPGIGFAGHYGCQGGNEMGQREASLRCAVLSVCARALICPHRHQNAVGVHQTLILHTNPASSALIQTPPRPRAAGVGCLKEWKGIRWFPARAWRWRPS